MYAQPHILRGTVSDEVGGLPGATIVELDANNRVVAGEITNMDGDYQIVLSSPNATVQYSFIGFKTVVENVNGRSFISVTLETDDFLLSEVVVTAEGPSTSLTGVNRRDQTGSSTIVSLDAIRGAVVSSVDDALQGQVAGLDIVGGGAPGSGSSIVIRGLGSLAGSTPLIVVDGVIQRASIWISILLLLIRKILVCW
jgi:hypothetical protein